MLTYLCAAGSGVLAWTLAEYLLHRFLGHDKRTQPNPFATEHTAHHSQGDYFAPGWKKALVAGLAVPVIALGASALVELDTAFVFASSFAGMYVAYELLHRRLHTHRGVGPYGRLLRRAHFHHHFVNPSSNHGVTSPLWDMVFGTWKPPQKIRVPWKLRMSWLVDANETLRADFASDYELLRP